MRELEEQHKARESTLLFEVSSAKKACERLEHEQAQASGREIFALTEELDSAQAQTDRVKLAKYRSETALEEDLAQSNAAVEMEKLEKNSVTESLQETAGEADRLRTALQASLKE